MTANLYVMCTDKGQHEPALLGEISFDGVPILASDKRIWVDDFGRLNLDCGQCPRHVEWKGANAQTILGKMKAARFSHLDISIIPF